MNLVISEKKSLQFIEAAKLGSLAELKALAEDPEVNTNHQDRQRLTAMHHACAEGQLQIVQTLLGLKGIRLNDVTTFGATPFFLACKQGRVAVVDLLLSLEGGIIDVTKGDHWCRAPLFMACMKGHAQVVSLLLDDRRTNVGAVKLDGASPFLIACECGNDDVVSLLLADGRADPNQPAKDGSTPFFMACQEDHLEVASLLLDDPRVDVNQPLPSTGATPFDSACAHGSKELITLLLNNERVEVNPITTGHGTPFYHACETGALELVSLLLTSERVEVNKAIGSFGVTPLQVACSHRQHSVVAHLVNHPRIDINEAGEDGYSVLWDAASTGNFDAVQILLASPQDVVTDRVPDGQQFAAAEEARLNGTTFEKAYFESDAEYLQRQANFLKTADLIYVYEKDKALVRRRLRRKLGLDAPQVGELFALVVYLSDGYFQIKACNEDATMGDQKGKDHRRFFRIASVLPMELQMVLCFRVFDLPDLVVKHEHSEPGFLKYAREPTQQPSRC